MPLVDQKYWSSLIATRLNHYEYKRYFMNRIDTGQLRISDVALKAKYALRISIVLAVAFASILAFFLYMAWFDANWRYYLLVSVTAVSLAFNLLAVRHSLKQQSNVAAYYMVGSITLFCLFTVRFLSGVGLVLGVSSVIAVYMISSLTLVQPYFSRTFIFAVVYNLALILLDAFFPFPRIENGLVTVYLPIVAFLSIGVFTYYLTQEFAGYPLRTKLILFFVIVAVFSVGAVAILINLQARSQITELVGTSQQVLADRLAYETGRELESQIDALEAAGGQYAAATQRQNNSYNGENDQIVNSILQLDKLWITAPDDNQLIQKILTNSTSVQLRQLQANFPKHVEIFLTDKYGALVGATARTSDYYQADEDWWKLAYALGRGKAYISQPEFDESSNTYGVQMAVPIFVNGKVIGILRSTYDVTGLIENLQQGVSNEKVEVDLRIGNDALMNGDPIDQNELPGLSRVMDGFGQIGYKGAPSLVSQQRVFSSRNNIAKDAVSQLGWSVIVHEDLADALAPVQLQTRTVTLTAVIIAILVGVLGLFAAQRLAAPILTLTDFTQRVAGGNLSIRAQITTQDEIGALAESFNRMTGQLQDTLGSLERRVAERTADLEFSRLVSERRAQELQIISEVSRTISTEQRLEILLPLVTQLVSDRFDFYHVGIFFVDETRQFAVLQAANSEGGRTMLARGHRLEVGYGIVGTVVQTGKARIALDVGSDATYFDNPDLPQTRSEMALPLNFRGESIGVLDVQSVKPGAFTESDANTLSILADQVAIAIENARLFGQTRQAREEIEVLYNQFLRTEWKTFLQHEESVGYRQSMVGGKLLRQPVETDEIRAALDEGRVIVVDSQNPKSLPTVAIPVRLRGQTIGVINIKAPTINRVWSQDELNLAQAVSDRLALALDGARLLQDSQRRAAKEAKIGEVTAKIGASINMRNVLQTAVEELGRALPGSEVVIQFESDEQR